MPPSRLATLPLGFFLCVVLFACSNNSSPAASGGADAGLDAVSSSSATPCATRNDCGTDQVCAYPTAKGCAATGVCVDVLTAECDAGPSATTLVCGCDGTTKSVYSLFCGLPSGFIATPVLHDGPCEPDAGAD